MTVAFRAAELECDRCAALSPDVACPARCERRFVVSAWSSSYKASRSAGILATDDWAAVMHLTIAKLLARPGSRAIVAYESTEPDFLYGFVAGDTADDVPVVFYVFVKTPYRFTGIARGLFAALGVDPLRPFVYACSTSVVHRLERKIPAARHDPVVARYPRDQRRSSTWQPK